MNKKELFNGDFFRRKLLLPLILFSFAGFGVVQLTPLLVQGTQAVQPATWQLAVVGTAIIILSALFLTYTSRLIGLTRGWLLLGVIFTSLMVIVKFILIPKALYSQEYILSGFAYFNPNDAANYFWIALLLFCIYVGVFLGAYKYYRASVRMALENAQKPKNTAAAPRSATTLLVILLVAGGLTLLFASGAGAILLFPLLYMGTPYGYLSAAIAGGGVVLVASTILTIVLSIKYLNHASNKAIEAKSVTILSVTFWIGFSLILVYHVLWVIFMGILLAIWPFKVISPSGK